MKRKERKALEAKGKRKTEAGEKFELSFKSFKRKNSR